MYVQGGLLTDNRRCACSTDGDWSLGDSNIRHPANVQSPAPPMEIKISDPPKAGSLAFVALNAIFDR